MPFTCKDLCLKERTTQGRHTLAPNESKCSVCRVIYITGDTRCYCCRTILSKRRTRVNNLSKKESVIIRY